MSDAKVKNEAHQLRNLNNVNGPRETRIDGVNKQDTGVFKDLRHSILASQYYAEQLQKDGKPTHEQLVAVYANWLKNNEGGNILALMRQHHEAEAGMHNGMARQIEAY